MYLFSIFHLSLSLLHMNPDWIHIVFLVTSKLHVFFPGMDCIYCISAIVSVWSGLKCVFSAFTSEFCMFHALFALVSPQMCQVERES